MRVHIRNLQRQRKISLPRLKRDSLSLLRFFNLTKTELSILIVNDRRMKALNFSFRGIDKTTDVLSFPIYESLKEIPKDRATLIGDIIICLPSADRQSIEAGCSFYGEVRRLLVHGFLHLMGYEHEKGEYHKKKMRNIERELGHALEKMD